MFYQMLFQDKDDLALSCIVLGILETRRRKHGHDTAEKRGSIHRYSNSALFALGRGHGDLEATDGILSIFFASSLPPTSL